MILAHNRLCATSKLLRYMSMVTAIGLVALYSASSAHAGQRWPAPSEIVASGQDWMQLSDLSLSERNLAEIERITSGWVIGHCPRVDSEQQRMKRIRSMSAKKLRLADDQTTRFAISEIGDWEGDSGSCPCESKNLNCRIWILELSKGHATVLLQFTGFGILVLNDSTHGHFDIVTTSVGKGSAVELTRWKFGQTQYERVRCASTPYPNGQDRTDKAIETVPKEHSCK